MLTDRLIIHISHDHAESRDRVMLRIQKLLDKVTYKPGWTISIMPQDYGNFFVLVRAKFPDAATSERRPVMIHGVRCYSAWTLEGWSDADLLRNVIYRAIFEVESHEIDEWFKWDGVHVRDPHPERKQVERPDGTVK